MAEKQLGARKAERLLRERADPALAKIREAMAAGKSFTEAAAAEGLQVQTFDNLDPSESLSAEQQGIAAASLLMQPGQLSGMIADAHCHFFSPGFFRALGAEAGALGIKAETSGDVASSR